MGVYARQDSRFWWMRVERPGRRPLQKSTGVAVDGGTPEQTRLNKQLAQAVWAAAQGDVVREKYDLPSDRPTPPPKVETWGEWSSWYEANVTAHLRGAERERELLKPLRGTFGTVPLPDVSRERVSEYMTARCEKASARTVNREVDLLKSTLRVAAEHGKIPASPLAGMSRLKVKRPKRRLASRSEETKVLKHLSPVDKAIYLIGSDSLVRLSDILDLRVDDVRGTTLYISDPKDPRQSEPYEVPLSKRTRAALKALPKAEGTWLFPSRRVAVTERDRRGAIRQALQRACKAAGVPYGRVRNGLSWHWATRRTGATRMIQAGIDPATVQEVGHWATADVVLEIYGEGSSAAAKRAVEVVGSGGESRRSAALPLRRPTTPRKRP